MRSYPNLFLAGAPKCGTTSMAYYLGQHPQIFSPRVKEPVFFGFDLTRGETFCTEEKYLNLYEKWSTERYALDASTAYFYSRSAAYEIRERSNDPRILMMVRNPVDAAYSLYYEHRRLGFETLETFEESLDAEKERAENRIPPKIGNSERHLYSKVYAYTENISHYQSVFGEDMVWVIVFDDLIERPKEVLEETHSFLGIQKVSNIALEVKNLGHEIKSYSLQSFAKNPPNWAVKLTKWLLSPERRHAIRDKILSLNISLKKNPPMNTETRQRLVERFTPEVERLSALLNRDLTHWVRTDD